MKLYKIILCCLLLMVASTSDAGNNSARSYTAPKSMSRGFSSNKPAAAMPTTRPSTSSFGSFNRQVPGTFNSSYGKPSSAMNRDLERNQAQQNAMKNWDARQVQKNTANTQAPVSVTGRPLPANSNPGYRNSAPIHSGQPSTAPVIVQNGGGSMNGVLGGVLLGQVLSRPHSGSVNNSTNGDYNSNNGGGLQSVTPDGEFKQGVISTDQNAESNPNSKLSSDARRTTQIPSSVAVPVQTANGALNTSATQNSIEKSHGFSFFSLLFWVGVIGVAIWFVRRKLRRIKATEKNSETHYTLGKV
jgi:hypothetical protein